MTNHTEMERREKFEAWAEEVGAQPCGYLKKQRNPSGGYSVQIYTYMWTAWKAAGAELVGALEKAQRANAAQDDHINQQQDRIDQLEKGHQEAAKQINSWRRMAKQNIAEREKDIAELDAARQRIAELESRTVTVKLPNQTQFDDPLSAYEAIEKCKEALTAQGIKWEAE